MVGELQGAAVLGDGTHDVVGGAIGEGGFNLKGDRDLGADMAQQVGDQFVGDAADNPLRLGRSSGGKPEADQGLREACARCARPSPVSCSQSPDRFPTSSRPSGTGQLEIGSLSQGTSPAKRHGLNHIEVDKPRSQNFFMQSCR